MQYLGKFTSWCCGQNIYYTQLSEGVMLYYARWCRRAGTAVCGLNVSKAQSGTRLRNSWVGSSGLWGGSRGSLCGSRGPWQVCSGGLWGDMGSLGCSRGCWGHLFEDCGGLAVILWISRWPPMASFQLRTCRWRSNMSTTASLQTSLWWLRSWPTLTPAEDGDRFTTGWPRLRLYSTEWPRSVYKDTDKWTITHVCFPEAGWILCAPSLNTALCLSFLPVSHPLVRPIIHTVFALFDVSSIH